MRVSGSLGFFLTVWYIQADSATEDAGSCSDLRVRIEDLTRNKDDLAAKLAVSSTQVQEHQQKLIEYDTAYKQLQTILETCNTNLGQTQTQLASCDASKQQSKEMDELKASLRTITQERDTLSAENLNIVQQNQALAADIAVKKSELEASAMAMKQLNTQMESLKHLSKTSKDELSSCSSAQTRLKTDLDNVKTEHGRKLLEAANKVDQLAKETTLLKQELSESTGKIYTASQFWTHVEHSKLVGVAFAGFARNRLIKLIGEDTYKLVNLQARIWYKKSVGGLKTVYGPVSTSTKIYYDRYARAHLNTAIAVVKTHLDGPMKQVHQQFDRGLRFVETYMDGVINNLSSVNPAVRDLFPTSFYDRCYAFAFISLVFYFASEFVQYACGLVWAGMVSMLGSKKKSKSSSTSGKRKLSGATNGKSVGSKQTKKDAVSKPVRS